MTTNLSSTILSTVVWFITFFTNVNDDILTINKDTRILNMHSTFTQNMIQETLVI